jgi:hypothetical protein
MKNIILLFALFPFVFISAQSNFNFNIDYASFKYDSSSNYVEFYYSFPTSQLKLTEDEGKPMVEGILHIELKNDSTGEDIVNKGWRIPNILKDTTLQSRTTNLIGVIGFIVPEGKYECLVDGSDFNNQAQKKSIKFSIVEKAFGTKQMTLSGIQLASNIKQDVSDKNSIFYKNTMEIIPMPSDIFGENSPIVFYY